MLSGGAYPRRECERTEPCCQPQQQECRRDRSVALVRSLAIPAEYRSTVLLACHASGLVAETDALTLEAPLRVRFRRP
jgi:hypothetical protein